MSHDNVLSMDGKRPEVKREGRWAPLRNVVLCARAMGRAMNREPNLPGFIGLYGPSGWGKSMAASYCANKFDGFYVVCRDRMTAREFVELILKEMGIKAERTFGQMRDQVATQLDLSGRPLIIDEADYLLDGKRPLINIVRDIHEMSRTAVLLVGEGQFPRKLKWLSERTHNRFLVWQPAQQASLEDARQLAQFYVVDKDKKAVEVADDLLQHVLAKTEGVARVICSNLDTIRGVCLRDGIRRIDLKTWGDRSLFTGDAPAARTVKEHA